MVNVVKSEEYFYGATLTKDKPSITWDAERNEEDVYAPNRLHLRQILLGHTAKPNEFNVVEVEAISGTDKTVKIPISVLKVGESRVAQPELEFPCGPVTFTLIEGSGPVYIHAQQVPGAYEDVPIDGGEEFDTDEEIIEEEEEFDDDEDVVPNKKQKIASKKPNSHKKK